MSYLQNAGAFLITSLFGFFICVFLARTMLIAVGASFYEPICRFVYLMTNPVIAPIRQIVPRWRRIELSSLLIAWLLCALELTLLVVLAGISIGVAGLALFSLVNLLDWAILIQLVAIIVLCVLSFIPSLRYDGNVRLLVQVTDPIVRPFRRLLPPMGGLDFSCWAASIALILVRMLVVAPLQDVARHLA